MDVFPPQTKLVNDDTCLPSHLFVELTSLDELSFPTSSSARLKYTCICASPHYLAVGSSSGTVYLFSRYAARYRKSLNSVPVQVIVNKEGAVEHIATSPNECHLAIGTNRGHVSVVNLSSGAPTTVLQNTLHSGTQLSAICWDEDNVRFYVGDTIGRVSCSRVGNRNLFRAACEMLLQLDSAVVQMDFKGNSLLISTLTRSYLNNSDKGTCAQIGRKPRSGIYGSCFYETENEEKPLIFAARPNGRLWEVDSDGAVYSTHQFTHLTNVPFLPVVTYRCDFDPLLTEAPDLVQFSKVYLLKFSSDQFLLTVYGSKLFVVEPKKARVVLVCDCDKDVSQYSVCGSDIFILNLEDGMLRKFSLFPYVKAVEKLHWRECFTQAAQVMATYFPILSSVPWKPDLITSVKRHMEDVYEADPESQLISRLASMLHRAKTQQFLERQSVTARATAVRLASGVHRVVRIMENSGYDDDFTFRAPSPLRAGQRSKSSPAVDKEPDRCLDQKPLNKRHSIPAPSPCHSHSEGQFSWLDTNEDSLRTLLGAPNTGQRVNFDEMFNRERIDEKSPKKANDQKSVYDNDPYFDTFEGRLLRSLEQGSKIVMDKVSSAANKYTVESNAKTRGIRPDIAYPMEMDYVTNCEPLTPMPDIPAVERRVPKKRRSKIRSNRHHHLYKHSDVSSSQSGHSDELNNTPSPLTDTALSTCDSQDITVNGNIGLEEGVFINNEPKSLPKSDGQISPDRTARVGLARDVSEEISDELDSTAESDRCERCSLHKSWWLVIKLGPFLPSVPVSPDDYLIGGVPASLKQWLELITSWKLYHLNENTKSKAALLCNQCNLLFSQSISQRAHILSESSKDDVITASEACEILSKQNLTLNDLCQIFKEKQEIIKETDKTVSCLTDSDTVMAYSTYYNPVYQSVDDTAGNNVNFFDHDHIWKWLNDVSLMSLLNCMCYVLGVETVLEAFEDQLLFVHPYVSDQVWACLAAQATRHNQVKMPPQSIIDSVFRDVLSLGNRTHSPTRIQYDNNKVTPNNSFVVDLSQYCPCCTLPLTTRVSDQGIVVFHCGHTYHRVCLDDQSVHAEDGLELNCFKCKLANGTVVVEIK